MSAAARVLLSCVVGCLVPTLWAAGLNAAEPEVPLALTADEQARVEGALAILTEDTEFLPPAEKWVPAIYDLVEVGKPAVPLILVELDKTDKNVPLRHLGFTLRAIGDPRAIPALIRVLRRTLMPPLSDYGEDINDPELLKFMQKHQDDDGKGNDFHYGRPFREVVAALRKLTGTQHWEMEINFVSDGGQRPYATRRTRCCTSGRPRPGPIGGGQLAEVSQERSGRRIGTDAGRRQTAARAGSQAAEYVARRTGGGARRPGDRRNSGRR